MLEPNYPGARDLISGKYEAFRADRFTLPEWADHTDHNCAWFAVNNWYPDWLASRSAA